MAGIIVYKNEGEYLAYTSKDDVSFNAIAGLMGMCMKVIKIKKSMSDTEAKTAYSFVTSQLAKINSQPNCIDKSKLLKELF